MCKGVLPCSLQRSDNEFNYSIAAIANAETMRYSRSIIHCGGHTVPATPFFIFGQVTHTLYFIACYRRNNDLTQISVLDMLRSFAMFQMMQLSNNINHYSTAALTMVISKSGYAVSPVSGASNSSSMVSNFLSAEPCALVARRK